WIPVEVIEVDRAAAAKCRNGLGEAAVLLVYSAAPVDALAHVEERRLLGRVRAPRADVGLQHHHQPRALRAREAAHAIEVGEVALLRAREERVLLQLLDGALGAG